MFTYEHRIVMVIVLPFIFETVVFYIFSIISFNNAIIADKNERNFRKYYIFAEVVMAPHEFDSNSRHTIWILDVNFGHFLSIVFCNVYLVFV